MAIPTLITGDDIIVPVPLTKNDATFVISGSATVKARLVSIDHKSAYSAEVTQSSATSGANWGASLVVVKFAPGDTADVTFQGLALLEVQVDDAGVKTTWFGQVVLVKGNIG